MDNFTGLLDIKGMDSLEYTDKGVVWSEEGVDERIGEGVLWWFGHVERMENDRIAKRVYGCKLVFTHWVIHRRNGLIL